MQREFCACAQGFKYTGMQADFALKFVKKVPCAKGIFSVDVGLT